MLLLLVRGSQRRVYRYSHSSSAFWYGGAPWSKDVLSDEREDSRLLMPVGRFFVVFGVRFLSRWTYCSAVLGLLQDWQMFLFRLKVTSRKFMVCLLASMVILNPLRSGMQHICFLTFYFSSVRRWKWLYVTYTAQQLLHSQRVTCQVFL